MARISISLVKLPQRLPRLVGFSDTFTRVARYALLRAVALILTVVVGVYLTVLITNMGGHVDNIRIGQAREAAGARVLSDPDLQALPPLEVRRLIEQQVQLEIQRLGWTGRLSGEASPT